MFQIQSVSKWARKVRVREFHFYSLRFRQHTTMKGAGRPSVWLWNKKYSGNNSQHCWQEKKKKNLLILARTYTVHTVIRCQKEQMDRWHEHYGGKEHLAASLRGNRMLWKPPWCSLMFSVSRGAGSDAASRFQRSSRELFNRAEWH